MVDRRLFAAEKLASQGGLKKHAKPDPHTHEDVYVSGAEQLISQG